MDNPPDYNTFRAHASCPKSSYCSDSSLGAELKGLPRFQRVPQISSSVSKDPDTDSGLTGLASSSRKFKPSCLEHLLLTAHVHLPPTPATNHPWCAQMFQADLNSSLTLPLFRKRTLTCFPGPGMTHSKCPGLCATLPLGVSTKEGNFQQGALRRVLVPRKGRPEDRTGHRFMVPRGQMISVTSLLE